MHACMAVEQHGMNECNIDMMTTHEFVREGKAAGEQTKRSASEPTNYSTQAR